MYKVIIKYPEVYSRKVVIETAENIEDAKDICDEAEQKWGHAVILTEEDVVDLLDLLAEESELNPSNNYEVTCKQSMIYDILFVIGSLIIFVVFYLLLLKLFI